MLVIKERIKNNSNTSSGKFGMVTLAPTVDTDSWMLTGCNLEDHVDVNVGVFDDWRVGQVDGLTVNELINDKDGDNVCTVVDDWVVGSSDDVDNKNS